MISDGLAMSEVLLRHIKALNKSQQALIRKNQQLQEKLDKANSSLQQQDAQGRLNNVKK